MATSCISQSLNLPSVSPRGLDQSSNATKFSNPLIRCPNVLKSKKSLKVSASGVTSTADRVQESSVDHYKRLGVDRNASTAQIVSAFEQKCKELAARRGLQSESAAVIDDLEDSLKQRLTESPEQLPPELSESTRKLLLSILNVPSSTSSNPPSFTESFDVLSSEETRRLYDWNLAKTKQPPGTYIWPFEADPSQRVVTGTPPRSKTEGDPEGTERVAIFIITSLIVSIVLNLYLGK